jgi:predicted anti-sigma-YlaC factor YlaD
MPMTCRELIEFLNDYVDDDLPDDQRKRFDEHLGLCSECRKYLATYRQTIRISKAAMKEQKAVIPEKLVKAILASKRA